MALPNPFRRRTENTVSCWGYTFEWTPEHPTEDTLRPYKYSYDTLGEQALEQLDIISPPPARSSLPRNETLATKGDVKGEVALAKRDLYTVLHDNHDKNDVLTKFWDQVNDVPEWVDWAQIQRGQDVFYRYGGANLTGLAYQSLLGGMGASRVVETLARTGGFSTKVARRRLYETTQHILQCTKSLESMQPGGEGWASTIRVRLLHAAVRNRITKLAAQRPDYYSVEDFGIPINDMDSIATINSFSSILIWLSLPRQGIFMRKQEITDYVALWRYIAYVIGCPTDQFADLSTCRKWTESLFYYELHPSPTSAILANNIIASLSERPPVYISSSFLIASARWLNGNALCDELGLPRVPLYYWLMMAGQCIFFASMAYSYRFLFSAESEKKRLGFVRKVFWGLIVEHDSGLRGMETSFEFQYVPEFSTLTEQAEEGSQRKIADGLRATEMRNLRWLAMGAGLLGLGTYVGIKAVGLLFRAIW